jgi:hypothetical protein
VLDEFTVLVPVVGDAVDIGGVFMEAIKAEFEAYVLKDEKANRDSDGEASDVDGAENFILQENTECDGDVIPEHKARFV